MGIELTLTIKIKIISIELLWEQVTFRIKATVSF